MQSKPTFVCSPSEVAQQLDSVGTLLAKQQANPFRARAYHAAAETVRRLREPLPELIAREGEAGLLRLPHIGPSIARAIIELVRTGRLRMHDRLLGSTCPEDLLASVPGIGPALARRIHERLHISTLEDLEIAAHDGRLATISGFGKRRSAAVRDVLDAMLRRAGMRDRPTAHVPERDERAADHRPPSVERLLALDARYRKAALAGELPTITPRRFNPKREAWLPVLHATEDDLHFTVLFSNTALAHRLGKTHEWVVIFFDGDERDHQHTVVTETSGPLAGLRVVRGRESECADYYRRSRADAH